MAEGLEPMNTAESDPLIPTGHNGTGTEPASRGQLLEPPSPSTKTQQELDMFAKVVSSNLTVQSQQRGEPDLTKEQKFEVLASLLHQRPGAFLMRFGKVLEERHLSWFDHLQGSNFEVDFRVKELRKNLAMSSKSRDNVIKNRRYQYLKELMESGSYFSEEEMRDRNPLLYEHYIGQYLSEEEKQLLDGGNSPDMTLSGMIMKKMELDRRSKLLSRQQQKEAGESMVESDESELSEEEEEEEEEEKEATDTTQVLGMMLSVDPDTACQEKQMLREEFLKAMQLRFLSGEEGDFDYSTVDTNEKYDSIEQRQRDEEDDYFDQEEPTLYDESHSNNDRTGMELSSGGMESETEDYMTYEPPS